MAVDSGYEMRRLENDLDRQLHVEGLAGADSGGAVEIADGVGDCTVTVDRSRPRGEVDAVEQVEHLRPELNLQALAEGNVFENGHVDVTIARAIKLVATDGSGTGAEGSGVHPLHA